MSASLPQILSQSKSINQIHHNVNSVSGPNHPKRAVRMYPYSWSSSSCSIHSIGTRGFDIQRSNLSIQNWWILSYNYDGLSILSQNLITSLSGITFCFISCTSSECYIIIVLHISYMYEKNAISNTISN